MPQKQFPLGNLFTTRNGLKLEIMSAVSHLRFLLILLRFLFLYCVNLCDEDCLATLAFARSELFRFR